LPSAVRGPLEIVACAAAGSADNTKKVATAVAAIIEFLNVSRKPTLPAHRALSPWQRI
jgi:hypothetical protein